MAKELQEGLQVLKHTLLHMIEKTTTMITSTVQGLLDRELSTTINIRELENEVNALELEIDNQCTRLLALQQPVASDLRFIVVAMKMSSDLERIADQSISLLNHTRALTKFPDTRPLTKIPIMANLVRGMVHDAIEAFEIGNSALAREILIRDDQVDALKEQIIQDLQNHMIADPKNIKPGLQLVLAVRNLERIADHATNIAEDIIYLIESKDVRHHSEESEQKI